MLTQQEFSFSVFGLRASFYSHVNYVNFNSQIYAPDLYKMLDLNSPIMASFGFYDVNTALEITEEKIALKETNYLAVFKRDKTPNSQA